MRLSGNFKKALVSASIAAVPAEHASQLRRAYGGAPLPFSSHHIPPDLRPGQPFADYRAGRCGVAQNEGIKRKGRRRAAPVAIPNVFSEAAYHTAERANQQRSQSKT